MDDPALPALPDGQAVFGIADYAFGDRTLRLHVTRIRGQSRHHGVDMVQVEGEEFTWDGRPMGVRAAYVRVEKLATELHRLRNLAAAGG